MRTTRTTHQPKGEAAPDANAILSKIRIIGSSAVFGQWGKFTRSVNEGTVWVVTYSREHGRDQGRGVSSEVRCMAVSPVLYERLAADDPHPVPVHDLGSYQARQGISTYCTNILQGVIHRAPVHYRVMFKRQEESVRHRTINGKTVKQVLPAQPGHPNAVLVSVQWFADRMGLNADDINTMALDNRNATRP